MCTRYLIPLTDKRKEYHLCLIVVQGKKITSEIVSNGYVPIDGIEPIMIKYPDEGVDQLIRHHSIDVVNRILRHALRAAINVNPSKPKRAYVTPVLAEASSHQAF